MAKERDLYKPVEKYFQSLGYKVNGEVLDCDLTAYNEEDLVIVELKLAFNMTLLFQGIDRQKYTNKVYFAIPKQKRLSGYRKQMKIQKICKALNFGLIIVDSKKNLEILEYPIDFGNVNSRYKSKLIAEINGRSINLNIGGVTGTKIYTAYLEKSIKIAYLISLNGEMSARTIKKEYLLEDTHKCLYNNPYKWFKKGSKKGLYSLTKAGAIALLDKENLKIVNEFKKYLSELTHI